MRPLRSASLKSLLSAVWTWFTVRHRQAATAAAPVAQQVGVERVDVGDPDVLQRHARRGGAGRTGRDLGGSRRASTDDGLGSPGRRATGRRTRPASSGSGRRRHRPGGRRGSGSARPWPPASCGTTASTAAVVRPRSTSCGRPTTPSRPASCGGRSCRWPCTTVPERYHGVTTSRSGTDRWRRSGRLAGTFAVPPAGFEPATHGLGNRRSIP